MEGKVFKRKADVSAINQGDCTRFGVQHIYPEGRKCKCGAKISIYNGMNKCHSCWANENLPPSDPDLAMKFESIMLNRLAGVR